MTIQLVKGNLLDAFDAGEVDVIGHCVNYQGVIGSGIAEQIKYRYPEVYRRYRLSYEAPHHKVFNPLLGRAQFVVPDEENYPWKIVVNLFGQDHYGTHKRQLNYGAISHSLDTMRKHVGFYNPKAIGFPYKMGSDRAGGDWAIVQEMIEYYFRGYDVKIYQLD